MYIANNQIVSILIPLLLLEYEYESSSTSASTPHPSGRLAQWGLALQEVDLHVHYRPGRKNANADTLSQNPVDEALLLLFRKAMQPQRVGRTTPLARDSELMQNCWT